MKAARALVVLTILVAIPDLSLACSVCTGGQTDQVTRAFMWATLFMIGLPLSICVIVGFALRHRLKQIAALEALDDPRRRAPSLVEPDIKTA